MSRNEEPFDIRVILRKVTEFPLVLGIISRRTSRDDETALRIVFDIFAEALNTSRFSYKSNIAQPLEESVVGYYSQPRLSNATVAFIHQNRLNASTPPSELLKAATHLTTFFWQSRFPITIGIFVLSRLDQVKTLFEWTSTHRTVGTGVAHNAEGPSYRRLSGRFRRRIWRGTDFGE
jgi:hypothetical protein